MPPDDLEDRMQRVEDALWGPWRNNGLVRDVKSIKEMVETQGRKAQEKEDLNRKDRAKNWLTAAGVIIAGCSALFTAIYTVAGG